MSIPKKNIMNLNNYAERVVSESSETTLFLNFDAFKGFALKNPMRGVAPQPHELFEKSSTKTFTAHFVRSVYLSVGGDNEKFFVHFFSKKWAGLLRVAALNPLNYRFVNSQK